MHQKTRPSIWFTIVILASFGVGYYAWSESLRDEQNIIQNSPSAPSLTKEGVGGVPERESFQGWQTYRNEEYGFEVKYPAKFRTAGKIAKNSSIGTYDMPVGGIFVGSLVLVIADKPQFREAADRYYKNYEAADFCEKKSETNLSVGAVTYLYCVGPPKATYYSLIKGQKFDVFFDGYSTGFETSIQLVESDTYTEEDLRLILSTFRFIE